MRTTLAIDDDVLAAARAIAEQQRKSVGEVVSALARRSLHHEVAGTERNGIALLRGRTDGHLVTSDIVNALRDDS